jgi:WD40 repeat protein
MASSFCWASSMRPGYLSLSLVVLTSTLNAAEPTGKVSYYKDIRPLFQQHCQGCHQPAKPLGGYIMTSYADLFKAGDSEKAGLVSNKPAESLLAQLLGDVKGRARMPKGKDALPSAQIKLINDWIAQGAIDDTPASAKAPLVDAEHPPVYQSLPVVTAVAYSPDGKYLAVSGYHETLLHHADGSGLVARLVGLSERVQSLAFSPDGKTLAASGGDPGRFGEIQLWNVEKRDLKLSIPVTFDTVYGVSWSPDGKLVAVGCADNTVRAFEVATGKQVLFQGAHSDWVMGTVFSQDGQHLVSISRDRSVKLTEVPTNRFIDNVTSITPGALKGGLLALALRPPMDPKKEYLIRVMTAATASPLRLDLLAIRSAGVGPKKRLAIVPKDTPGQPAQVYDEILVAGADGQPRLYKVHREVKRVIGDDANKIREFEKLPGRVYVVSFSSDGSKFAAGSSLDGTGETRVYDVESGKRISTFEGVKTPIYSLAFHPDGNSVATTGFDGKVRINDANTGKLIREFVPVPMK